MAVNNSVQVLIYIYLAICICMIVFNCVCIFVFKKKDRNSQKRDTKFGIRVKRQALVCEKGARLPEKELKYLKKNCRRVWNMAMMDDVLTALKDEHPKAVSEYIRQITPTLGELCVVMLKKDDIQKSHYAYFLYKYDVVRNKPIQTVTEFALTMTKSANLYCRENALKVLYTTGDAELVAQAILHVSQSGYFHHEKLLVDGMLGFAGDRDELMRNLMAKRTECSLSMQLIILNFVRFGSDQFTQEFYEILNNEHENDELRFSALRYFGKYPNEMAYPQICRFAENREERRWEFPAIAATVLASYPREYTVKILKKCLSNYNWFIRANAAESLEKLNLNYLELSDIFDSRDRYAREILQYRMELKQQREDEEKLKAMMKGGKAVC